MRGARVKHPQAPAQVYAQRSAKPEPAAVHGPRAQDSESQPSSEFQVDQEYQVNEIAERVEPDRHAADGRGISETGQWTGKVRKNSGHVKAARRSQKPVSSQTKACTAKGAPACRGLLGPHPFLQPPVPICEGCHTFYTSEEFQKDDATGHEKYCRWCGENSGKAAKLSKEQYELLKAIDDEPWELMFNCDFCDKAFCGTHARMHARTRARTHARTRARMSAGGCLARNLPPAVVHEINSDNPWRCLVCDNTPLQELADRQMKKRPANPEEDPDLIILKWMVDLEFESTTGSEEECSLCLEEMKNGIVKSEGGQEEWVVRTACGHRFHRTCLHAWLQKSAPQNRSCPMCRAGI